MGSTQYFLIGLTEIDLKWHIITGMTEDYDEVMSWYNTREIGNEQYSRILI